MVCITSNTGDTIWCTRRLRAITIPNGIPSTTVMPTATTSKAMVCNNDGHKPNAPIKNSPTVQPATNSQRRVACQANTATSPSSSHGGIAASRRSIGNSKP